jgi:hypothetical protein
VERIWPILANVGPSSSMAPRSRRARSRRAASLPVRVAVNSSWKPWRARTRPIRAARPRSGVSASAASSSTAWGTMGIGAERFRSEVTAGLEVLTMITVHRAL